MQPRTVTSPWKCRVQEKGIPPDLFGETSPRRGGTGGGKMKKISTVMTKTGLEIAVYYDSKRKVNPFAIYGEWTGNDTKHRKLLDRYANYDSCLCYIWDKRNENRNLFNYESIA